MPCTVTRAEELYFEQMDNLKKYGCKETNERITAAVACELGGHIARLGAFDQLSPMAKKWIVIHTEEDKAR